MIHHKQWNKKTVDGIPTMRFFWYCIVWKEFYVNLTSITITFTKGNISLLRIKYFSFLCITKQIYFLTKLLVDIQLSEEIRINKFRLNLQFKQKVLQIYKVEFINGASGLDCTPCSKFYVLQWFPFLFGLWSYQGHLSTLHCDGQSQLKSNHVKTKQNFPYYAVFLFFFWRLQLNF